MEPHKEENITEEQTMEENINNNRIHLPKMYRFQYFLYFIIINTIHLGGMRSCIFHRLFLRILFYVISTVPSRHGLHRTA